MFPTYRHRLTVRLTANRRPREYTSNPDPLRELWATAPSTLDTIKNISDREKNCRA